MLISFSCQQCDIDDDDDDDNNDDNDDGSVDDCENNNANDNANDYEAGGRQVREEKKGKTLGNLVTIVPFGGYNFYTDGDRKNLTAHMDCLENGDTI